MIFKTKIYHPNIDKFGNFYYPTLNDDNWSPAIKVRHLIKSLQSFIYHYEDCHFPLDQNIKNHFKKDEKSFCETAK